MVVGGQGEQGVCEAIAAVMIQAGGEATRGSRTCPMCLPGELTGFADGLGAGCETGVKAEGDVILGIKIKSSVLDRSVR